MMLRFILNITFMILKFIINVIYYAKTCIKYKIYGGDNFIKYNIYDHKICIKYNIYFFSLKNVILLLHKKIQCNAYEVTVAKKNQRKQMLGRSNFDDTKIYIKYNITNKSLMEGY